MEHPRFKNKYVLNMLLQIKDLKGSACTFSIYMMDATICNFGFSGLLENNCSFLSYKDHSSFHTNLYEENLINKYNKDRREYDPEDGDIVDFKLESLNNKLYFYVNNVEICSIKSSSPIESWFFNQKRATDIKILKRSYTIDK